MNYKSTFKFISLIFVLLGSFLLASCENTMAGFGKDMQQTGQQIQKKANEH